MRRPLSPWIDCLLWLLAGWLAGLTVTVLGMALDSAVSPGPWFRSLLNVAPNLAGTGLVLLLGLWASRSRPAVVLSLRRPPWAALPWVALSSLCLALLCAGLNIWIEKVLPMPPAIEEIFEQILEYHTFPQFLGVFFFLVILAPVSEELMFRGLFLHRLSESHGPVHAIVGSAFLFGVFHLLPWQVVGATLIGIYLGWLVKRTGSILMPIAAHAFVNLVPVAANGLSDRAPAARGLGTAAEDLHLTPALLAGAALALAAGILGTLRTTRRPPESPSSGTPPGPDGRPAGPFVPG